MNKERLDITGVKAYIEKAYVATDNTSFKVAVLKVRYSDGGWDIIFRKIITHTTLTSREAKYIEEYKGVSAKQIKQISSILKQKEQKIFGLYLKKYLKTDLNISSFVTKRNYKNYIETKKCSFLTKFKTLFRKNSTISNNA
ncbi:MAG: hypothetical protein E7170_02920 [Firmicutes bacterium]|nr:hypothetical protein [Bacillota bacterium]